MVGELHRDAQRLQHRDRLAAEVVRDAGGHVVEVARLVHRHRLALGVEVLLEQVELDLRVGVEGEPGLCGFRQGPLEHEAGVLRCRLAIGGEHVAEHPRGALAAVRSAAPGQRRKGGRVRADEHVGLDHPRQALDGRAVEADALGERGLQLRGSHGDRLQRAEHVGEPEPDEPDVALLDGAEHELLLTIHVVHGSRVPTQRHRAPRRLPTSALRRMVLRGGLDAEAAAEAALRAARLWARRYPFEPFLARRWELRGNVTT